MTSKEPREASQAPSISQHLKWSLGLVLACVVLAKLAIPILRWLGFD